MAKQAAFSSSTSRAKKPFLARLPRALPKQARLLVESAIERHHAATEALIAFLDAADGDPDTQPSLGSLGSNYGACRSNQENWSGWAAANDDREEDAGDEGEAGEDQDHDLGWPEMMNQARASTCDSSEGEEEPSLGSLDGEINQAKWSRGNRSDLEEQCEDEGHDSDREPEWEDSGRVIGGRCGL